MERAIRLVPFQCNDCVSFPSQNGRPWFYIVTNYGMFLKKLICFSKQCPSLFSGESPYPGVKPKEIAGLLRTGYRMPKPSYISQEL